MSESLNAFALFFSLLNPFLMSIYMLGIIRNSDAKVFNMALIQGSLISFIAVSYTHLTLPTKRIV